MSRKFKCSLPKNTCIMCYGPVVKALQNCEPLKLLSHRVDVVSKTITITVDDNATPKDVIITHFRETIEELNVACENFEEIVAIETVMVDETNEGAPPPPPQQTTNPHTKKRTLRTHVIKGVIGLAAGAGLMALALSGVFVPMIGMYIIVGLGSLLTLALGATSYRDAFVHLVKSRALTMDALFAVSTLAIIGVSIASLFVPWLTMMIETALLIFAAKYAGKAIEEVIKAKVTAKLKLEERAAKMVLRKNKEDDGWTPCPSDQIRVGDLIRILHGQKIPVDGVLQLDTDEAWLDESNMDGSTEPHRFNNGAKIYAGMKVPKKNDEDAYGVDYVDMRVTHSLQYSYIARQVQESEKYSGEQAPIEKKADTILKFFIPTVFAVAAIAGVVVGVLFNPMLAIQCATAVLVSACPCTFGFITPLSIKFGVTKAEKLGVNFKSSEAMHQADKIDTVVFDLNGTLTTGKPVVTDHEFYGAEDMTANSFLEIAAAIEGQSNHAFAKAIRAYAAQKSKAKVEYAAAVDDKTYHSGVKACINDDEYFIGNSQFLEESGVDIERQVVVTGAEQVVYVVKNYEVIGHFKIEDPLRPDAQFAIKELKDSGKDIHICTGAEQETALRYAGALGIPAANVYAGCRGASDDENVRSKTAYITMLQGQNKRVAMIGDAGNDSGAVAKSDFGVAVNSASSDPLTYENAGATVKNACLLPVVTAFAVAKQTMRSVKQNLIFSLTYNMAAILVIGGVLIGVGFAINPAIGAALMVVQMALILLNQYRIYKQRLPHIKRYKEQQHVPVGNDSTYNGLFRQNGLGPQVGLASRVKRGDSMSSLQPADESEPLLLPSARLASAPSSPRMGY